MACKVLRSVNDSEQPRRNSCKMAEPGRTVRVSGLPADIEDDRLRDKLFIHFLRARNGGGEINSVTIVKATPVSALITFEDSGVAQSVIQHRRHTLEVDEKKYKVIVTEHRESLDPDKVILSLSATVDYSQLPGGIMAITSLHTSHPVIRINYDAPEETCTLNGAYSNVQAALAQLFGLPKGPQSAENKDSGQPATSGSRTIQAAQEPHIQDSESQSRKPNKQREPRENVHIGRPSDAYNPGPHRDLSPGGYVLEDTGQTEGAALQLPVHPTTTEEDFSLIVDADMFQYLQKHCRKEYQLILSQYGVDVVDMTNQGLTTLFLQVATGVGEDGRNQESLKLARKAISRLYEENETKIRRDQLPKSILSLRGGQQSVMDTLSVRFPQLLLNEDDLNIYIIGNSGDVSEAKQLLLLGPRKVKGKKEDVASLLRYPPYDSGSSTRTHEQRVPHTLYSTADSQGDRIDQQLRSEEDERKAEGSSRYKLAARFKDSGLAALGSRSTDFTLRGLSPPIRQTHQGPILGHDVLSETAGIFNERVSSALAQNTGGDILFKSRDALSSKASMQNKTSKAHLIDTRPNSLTSPITTIQSSASGSAMFPPPGSGSTLKRTRSFSGTPLQKAQVVSQKSQDDSAKLTLRDRGRSSSFSHQTGRDKREVYKADITVSSVMWKHIKEAYSSRVDDLTSDVQMKESGSAGSDLTVTLRGANSSNVSSCQLGLQNLVDSVHVDFSVHELRLSELGITEADETLQACCAEVQDRFKKVSMHILDKGLYIYGPKVLGSQVGATLREVFSGKPAQIPEQQDLSGPSTSEWSPTTFLQMNEEDQSTSLHCYSNPQVMLESQTSKADVTDTSQERRTQQRRDFHETELVNGSIHQLLVRKDPVIKEKVKIVKHSETVEMDGQKTESFVSHTETGIDSASHVNDVTSTTAPTDEDMSLHKKERTIHSTHKDSMQRRRAETRDTPEEAGPGGPGGICVCGEREMFGKTKCGAAMCSECLDTVHVHCRVCHETEATSWGIQGKMSPSKLNISVPGHKNDSAIKITYCIPDGIQGEDQPSPGEPFQGGSFEAYLPDDEKSRKLVPRLREAFRQGLTFTVTGKDTGARVSWDCIPHKTTIHGGKSGNGYPDSTYLTRLSEVLTAKGIGEPPAKS